MYEGMNGWGSREGFKSKSLEFKVPKAATGPPEYPLSTRVHHIC